MRVRAFLRQPLFTISGSEAHVPHSAMVLEGELGEQSSSGLTIRVQSYFDDRGRKLEGATAKERTLILPGGKVDHLLVLE
ncbi:MAG TPA: hypothetical protein PKY30_14395 [Myxococcota bacterium]|nr:hypothetical protein [Myxococcota bacterium]HND28567.1 hypothetical protein [Myxococcota bacterium]HNH48227.1 hypothetical protein [Myxococcota bacterium]